MFTLSLFILIVNRLCEIAVMQHMIPSLHYVLHWCVCLGVVVSRFFQVEERKAVRRNSVWQVGESEGTVASLTLLLN